MKVSVSFAFLAVAIASVHATDFSAEDQAIWIDRHNYFRTTGLPWSAGDMRRIGWSSDLATTAASTAEGCAASTASGVNVFQSTSSNSSSVIDEAIQSWVVETSMSTLSTLSQPGAVGVDVGTGVYNSYSQVLWASTTSVGCATASCSGGDLVVCNYSPAGNDGSSPWYVHAETASNCPSGTTASSGLCIVEGDAANEQIAAIPAGKLTYEVYPAYVVDMQTVLLEAARATASGSTTTTPTATTAAPTGTTTATSDSTSSESSGSSDTSTKQTATSSSGSKFSAASKTDKTASSDSSSETSSATKTGKTTTSAQSSSSGSSTATKKGKTTTSSSSTDPSSSSSTKQSSKKSTTDSSSSSSTKQSSTTTSDESAPGTVKASSGTGSIFTNQASTTTESPTTQTSGSTTTASAPSTANAESTATSSGASTSINNQSSTKASGGISAAGMAGMIVLAVVGVAALGVVTSYKRNQKRQREIMRDGGIRLI